MSDVRITYQGREPGGTTRPSALVKFLERRGVRVEWPPGEPELRSAEGDVVTVVLGEHPGITEPAASVTVDLTAIFAGTPAEFAAGQSAVNAVALAATTRVFAATDRLVVLDWQHPSWWFYPQLQAIADDQQWPIPVFPDGDYYAFLAEDMSTGTFGHPWEQTLCVWGKLMPVLAPMLTAWLPVKRSMP